MACGDKYAWMLVTESGLTPDEPFAWWPGPEDYDEWSDVVRRVEGEVLRKWDYLLDTEDKLAQLLEPPVDGPYPERDVLLAKLQELTAATESVHGVFRELFSSAAKGEWTWETSIRKAIDAGRIGTCVLELLDQAIAYYQRPPYPSSVVPREPGTGKENGNKGGGASGGTGSALVTLAMLIGGGYYVWRRRKRS